MRHADSSWWVYICSKNDKLYVGITTDLKYRMKQHAGLELLYREGPLTESEAADRNLLPEAPLFHLFLRHQ